MSFLLDCPNCGAREVGEFKFQGEVNRRPASRPTLHELGEYLYFRHNVAGPQREWWYHRAGCGLWFVAERDTRTNEVASTDVPPTLRPVPRPPDGPSAA